MKASLVFIFVFVVSANAVDPNVQYIRKEVEFGKTVNLRDFGGPHIEVYVRNRELSYVTAESADFTRMVPVARMNIQSVEVNNFDRTATVYGSPSVTMQPTRNTRQIKKDRGTAFPGSRYTMYSLYQEPSTGIQVYFLDAISAQNHDSLVIAIPKAPPLIPPHPPLPSPHPAGPTQQENKQPVQNDDQPISPGLFTWYVNLQKKRETLDTSNPETVAQFNLDAAAYHDALAKARLAQKK